MGRNKRAGSKAFGTFLDDQFLQLRGKCLSEDSELEAAVKNLQEIKSRIKENSDKKKLEEDRLGSCMILFREDVNNSIKKCKEQLEKDNSELNTCVQTIVEKVNSSSQGYFYRIGQATESYVKSNQRLGGIWDRANEIQEWYWWPWKNKSIKPENLFSPDKEAGQGPFLFGISYLHSELNSGFASPLRSRASITHLTIKPYYSRRLPSSLNPIGYKDVFRTPDQVSTLKLLEDQTYRSEVEDRFRLELEWQAKPDYNYSKQAKTRPIDALFFCEQMKDRAASSGYFSNKKVGELNSRLWSERLASMGTLGIEEAFEQFISVDENETQFRRFSWREHYSGYQTWTFVREASRAASPPPGDGVDPVDEFFRNTTDVWTEERRDLDPRHELQAPRHQRRATTLDAFEDVLTKDMWTGSVFGNYVHGANYLVFRFKDLLTQLYKADVRLSALIEPAWMWERRPGRPRIMLDRQFIRLLERHRTGTSVDLVALLEQSVKDQRFPSRIMSTKDKKHTDDRIRAWGRDFMANEPAPGPNDEPQKLAEYQYVLGAIRQMLTSPHPGHSDQNTAYQLAIYLLRSSLADHFGMYGILSRNFEVSASSVMGGRGLIVSNVRNNVSHWEETEALEQGTHLHLKNFDLFTRTVLIDFGLNEYERGRIISSLTRYSSERIAPLSNVRGCRNAIMAIAKISTEVEEAAANWRAGTLESDANQQPTKPKLTAERRFLQKLNELSRKLDYVDSSLPDGIEAASATAAGTRMVLDQLLRQLDIGEVRGFTSLRTYTDRRIGKVIGVFEACGARLVALRRRMKELRSQVGVDFEQDQTVDMRHILEQIDGITPFGRMYYGGSVVAGLLLLLFLVWPSGESASHHGDAEKAKYFLAAFGFAVIALIWGGSEKQKSSSSEPQKRSLGWYEGLSGIDGMAKKVRAFVEDNNTILRVLLMLFAILMLGLYIYKIAS